MTMCRVLELEKILDFNYTTKIGLSVYVKFSLSKWLGTRQKIIQIIHKSIKNTRAVECMTKSTTIVFVITSLQFKILRDYQGHLSIKQHKYVQLSSDIVSWLSNNILYLKFQRCSIRFA